MARPIHGKLSEAEENVHIRSESFLPQCPESKTMASLRSCEAKRFSILVAVSNGLGDVLDSKQFF
jgi:hypothetical protein